MSPPRKISQRDLRNRSRELMDAVEHGESFTVTRNGRGIGEPIPPGRTNRFVSRDEFARASKNMPKVDPDRLRVDIDAVIDPDMDDPFERPMR